MWRGQRERRTKGTGETGGGEDGSLEVDGRACLVRRDVIDEMREMMLMEDEIDGACLCITPMHDKRHAIHRDALRSIHFECMLVGPWLREEGGRMDGEQHRWPAVRVGLVLGLVRTQELHHVRAQPRRLHPLL